MNQESEDKPIWTWRTLLETVPFIIAFIGVLWAAQQYREACVTDWEGRYLAAEHYIQYCMNSENALLGNFAIDLDNKSMERALCSRTMAYLKTMNITVERMEGYADERGNQYD